MNQALQVFQNEQLGQVRVIEKDGEPWFVARDVCEALELDLASGARGLDADEKGLHSVQTPGGVQEVSVISEPGLYSLILRSRKAEAKTFKRWITHEVIPSIRKHGMYATPQTVEDMLNDPETTIKILTALKEEREQRKALECKVEKDAPKVLFADSVSIAQNSILVGDLAKLICQNGVSIGQNRLFEWLRQNGFLISRKSGDYNRPTQRAMEMKLFEVKERAVNNPDGTVRVTFTTKVTGKGQVYFVNAFLKHKQPES